MRKTWLALGCVTIAGWYVLSPATADSEIPSLHQPVEILFDHWGVPHIYAKNTDDLFFAQGWVAARDRLFQLDLWRRIGSGRLAEVLGPSAIPRDRMSRLLRYRGDWDKEWTSYAPDTKQIATAFANGINAYIHTLGGQRTLEFHLAGYDPGTWTPEDVVSRAAGLQMLHNVSSEVQSALDITRFGIEKVQTYLPPDPFRALDPAQGVDLSTITTDILRDFSQIAKPVALGQQGSNNWVVDGTMTASGKPLLANDPHRATQIPSLRKTVHLVAPGWDAIGAGEPALPGIALGHNEHIAFGFTIVGMDQEDLYVETLNPENPLEYRYKGEWKKMEVERQDIPVKDMQPQTVELHYTIHGPVIREDLAHHRAYALRSVATEPGTAGYLAGLSIARASNWDEFRSAVSRFKVPSENIIYADTEGNIGWIAAGLAPVRKNWSGLLPVPGENGDYEWSGFLSIDDLPQSYNPPNHHIATANNNILPPAYDKQIAYEWASPERHERIEEMLATRHKFNVEGFEKMQQDILSLDARRFMALLGAKSPLSEWDGRIRVDSEKALLYEVWVDELPRAVFGRDLGARVSLQETLKELEQHPNPEAIAKALEKAKQRLNAPIANQQPLQVWGDLHKVFFQHPLNRKGLNRGPFARPGDATTVNATSGLNFQQTSGASFREVIDLADWDRSVITNAPGESGDPESKHYDDLITDWMWGQYHQLPFSRRAVEAATEHKLMLMPKR
ncbi:MAG: penicillin acylase family protein [Bryobacteraceae bacterium]